MVLGKSNSNDVKRLKTMFEPRKKLGVILKVFKIHEVGL